MKTYSFNIQTFYVIIMPFHSPFILDFYSLKVLRDYSHSSLPSECQPGVDNQLSIPRRETNQPNKLPRNAIITLCLTLCCQGRRN